MNILIVEDHDATSEAIAGIIEHWNHKVKRVATGKEALAKLGQKEFHLVLLDIFLPDFKGYDLIPLIKQLSPQTDIVTMTGHNSRELELEIRKQGILYYMIKPFENEYLKSLLDYISQKKLSKLTV